jgi:hypothetical protein
VSYEQAPAVTRRPAWLALWVPIAAAALVGLLVGIVLGSLDSGGTRTVTATAVVTVTADAPEVPTNGGQAATGGQLTDGVYVVGVDIPAGNYHTAGGNDCYWERLNNVSGGFTAIIANGKSSAEQTVRVQTSDKAFGIKGGCAWTRIE